MKGARNKMAKPKNYAKTPLLYIHQPDMTSPKAQMQSNYVGKKEKTETKPPAPKKYARIVKQNNTAKKISEEVVAESFAGAGTPSKDKQEKKDKQEAESSKKFSDMTIQEKIDYFLNKPVHIPRMRCEVKTEERTYRGKIQSLEGENILMQVGRRTSLTKIKVSAITEIRLIGF